MATKKDAKKLTREDVIAMMLNIYEDASSGGGLKLEVCNALIPALTAGGSSKAIEALARRLGKSTKAADADDADPE